MSGQSGLMPPLAPTSGRARAAAQVLCNYLQPSPLRLEPGLSGRLGCQVFAKYEFENPVRSFKIRGALNLLSHLAAASEARPARLVTASTGNHGAAMAFACRKFSMPLIVGVPVDCDRSKVALIHQYGPELRFVGRDMDETKEILLEEFYKLTGHLVEGAGAAALAAALEAGDSMQGRKICLIATGANVDEALKQEILTDFV